jgi:hypothetical protein
MRSASEVRAPNVEVRETAGTPDDCNVCRLRAAGQEGREGGREGLDIQGWLGLCEEWTSGEAARSGLRGGCDDMMDI